MRFIKKGFSLLQGIKLDSATSFVVLNACKSFVFGPVTVLLIAAHFTPAIQGYYYTFGSVLALQVFAELGLGHVIAQFVSHEWAFLSMDNRRKIVGSPEALSRLASISAIAFKWYAMAGVLAAFGLGVGGYVFFAYSPTSNIHWVAPWLVLCLMTGIRFLFGPFWSILEGCNQVAEMYGSKFFEGISSTLAAWLAIYFGGQLWTASIAASASLLWNTLFFRIRFREFFRSIWSSVAGSRVEWLKDILPMQWRIALSWISGTLASFVFNPVLFHYRGPVEAGRQGMTLSLLTFLTGISSAWLVTRSPRFGALIARQEYAKLDRLFLRCTMDSIVITVLGGGAVWTGTYVLYYTGVPFSKRILPPLPTAWFLLAILLWVATLPMQAYLRAHKKEPLLGVSITTSVLIAAAALIFGSRFGAVGIGASYFAVVALCYVPWVTAIWYRCRAAWHNP